MEPQKWRFHGGSKLPTRTLLVWSSVVSYSRSVQDAVCVENGRYPRLAREVWRTKVAGRVAEAGHAGSTAPHLLIQPSMTSDLGENPSRLLFVTRSPTTADRFVV
jgi:hypothetical protein